MAHHSRRRLSVAVIEKLRPEPRAYSVTDLDCPGLMLHVATAGTKSWHYRYYWQKERRLMTLGRYPETGLRDARDLARRVREAKAKKIDPREAGIAASEAPPPPPGATPRVGTVAALAEAFMRHEITPNRKRPGDVRWALDKYVLPKWAGRDARSITPKEVRELLFGIADRGTKVTANRITSLVSQMFLYAVERDIIPNTPVQLLRKKPGGKERPRTRALTDKELAVYLRDPIAATRYERLSRVITILLLTAARRGELVGARWHEIDLHEKTWLVPAANAKNGLEHLIPLSDAAVAEFRELKKVADAQRSRWVLPGTDPAKHIEPKLLTRGVAKCLKRFARLGIEESRNSRFTISAARVAQASHG